MTTKMNNYSVEPYLSFGGRCAEALEFYKTAIGAEVLMAMKFKDSPDPMPPEMCPPEMMNNIMHATLKIGQSTIMASDGCPTDEKGFCGFSLALAVADETEADRAFAALGEGGKVVMPLEKTFWSPRFGMVEDKFGVSWMVNVVSPDQKGC